MRFVALYGEVTILLACACAAHLNEALVAKARLGCLHELIQQLVVLLNSNYDGVNVRTPATLKEVLKMDDTFFLNEPISCLCWNLFERLQRPALIRLPSSAEAVDEFLTRFRSVTL